MNLTQELERLAKLHAEGALNAEEFAKAKSQFLSAQPSQTFPVKGIRRQSARTCCGLPLWAIAIGPDLSGARCALHRSRRRLWLTSMGRELPAQTRLVI